MTKADIVAEIAEKTGLEKVDVQTTVEAFMKEVKESLEGGENVYLRGFGSFIIKERAKKTGRNISKNTTIIIPAHNIPSFKPAKVFVDGVKTKVEVKINLMKRSPFIAIVLGLVLALYIYTSSVRPKRPSVKKELSIKEQIQSALSNIQDADNPQSQMKGILQLRSLSEKYPENADLHWNMGLFSIQSGQYEKAVARFEKVINIDAKRLDAYMQLATSYLAIQDTSAAKDVLISLIDKSEGDFKKMQKRCWKN